MFKKNPNAEKTDESVKETKANAKKATKGAAKKAAKEAADKLLAGMAASLPGAGASKSFITCNLELDKLEKQFQAISLAKRGVRAKLKEQKVDLACLDRVRKLRQMEPEDVKAKKATEALYEEQLSMPLSEEQKKIVSDLNKQREENKKTLLAAHGGDTGKEVGTSANRIPERTEIDEAPPAGTSGIASTASH